jgi:hypothetical protein
MAASAARTIYDDLAARRRQLSSGPLGGANFTYALAHYFKQAYVMYRIILDRSIFHKDKFLNLKQSNLQALVSSNDIQLFYTPLFLEETLQYHTINITDFKNQWNYIVSINPSKWFHLASDIIPIELGNSFSGRKYYLHSLSDIQTVVKNVELFLVGNAPMEQYTEAQNEISKNDLVRTQFRKDRIDLRQSVPRRNYSFDNYVNDNAEWYIENGLMKWHTNSANFLTNWRNQQSKCRFTQSFIRAWFSTLFLPVANHQLKIDINDKSDAEQLAYLEWGDIFVSDDEKFMKEAFHLLYGKSQKRFMSSAEFIAFIKQI